MRKLAVAGPPPVPFLVDATPVAYIGSTRASGTFSNTCHRRRGGVTTHGASFMTTPRDGHPTRAMMAPMAIASQAASKGLRQGSTGGSKKHEAALELDGEQSVQSATARRLKMVVAYDGSEFAGFQFQPGKVRTVQGELERCAKRLFLGCSRMVGASRTDGGAHAYGQVVHFDVYGNRDSLESDVLYYNSFLPPDVRVLGLSYADDGFDSHFSSCGKTYLYKFAASLPDPMQSKYRWWVYDRWCERSRGKPGRLSDVELDVGLMRQAAELLLGRHDFSAFMDNKRPSGLGSAKRKNPKLAERGIKPERTSAKNTRILSHLQLHESTSPVSGGQEVVMEVTGNGFLYRMVRMLAAGLVEVGHRRLTPAGLRELLQAADRSALPEAAPPHGLYLASVHYPGDQVFESRIHDLAARLRGAGAASYGHRRPGSGLTGSGLTGSTSESGSSDDCAVAVAVAGRALGSLDSSSREGSDPRRGGHEDEARATAAAGDGEAAGTAASTSRTCEHDLPYDEAESVARELRMTQGQKAAALMRAAAVARRAVAGDEDGGGGEGLGLDGGGYDGQGTGFGAGEGPLESEQPDYSQLRDRDDDQ